MVDSEQQLCKISDLFSGTGTESAGRDRVDKQAMVRRFTNSTSKDRLKGLPWAYRVKGHRLITEKSKKQSEV